MHNLKEPMFDFRVHFFTLRPWKRRLSASDAGPTARRAKSDSLSVYKHPFLQVVTQWELALVLIFRQYVPPLSRERGAGDAEPQPLTVPMKQNTFPTRYSAQLNCSLPYLIARYCSYSPLPRLTGDAHGE
jgi:hypothetical protein